ncbi:MAG: hypothetical protein IJK14_07570 [Clostridia bacterium]|nr:hypothetical protein [Clostridia bacterium]MBR0445208.1 hypothetical protein [Clostridia bacterium]
MNAVIVDIRGRHAAALREDGAVVRIRNQGYEIGQQLDLHEMKTAGMSRAWKRAISGTVAAAMVIVAGAGTAYAMPYGTVTLDADSDSSLVYTINCFDYVLDVKGGNESGETLLLEMDRRELRHRPVDRAISATVEKLGNQQHNGLSFDSFQISTDAGNGRHRQRLQKKLDGFSQPGGKFDGKIGPKGHGRANDARMDIGTENEMSADPSSEVEH